jgi:hypothetical protein
MIVENISVAVIFSFLLPHCRKVLVFRDASSETLSENLSTAHTNNMVIMCIKDKTMFLLCVVATGE